MQTRLRPLHYVGIQNRTLIYTTVNTKQIGDAQSRKLLAILSAQGLIYALIITFIFADAEYHFISAFLDISPRYGKGEAYFAACLIAISGTISIWLTWFYANKSNSMRDMLVICAWTHRVKSKGQWVSLENFFTEQLGYVVSHGLSDKKLVELRKEVDQEVPRLQKYN